MIMRYMQSMEYEGLILESSCSFMQNKQNYYCCHAVTENSLITYKLL